MNTVRAKFTVSTISHSADGGIYINMHPVLSGSEENKTFSDYTPGGRIELNISAGKEAQKLFVPGKSYYIDFTPAE